MGGKGTGGSLYVRGGVGVSEVVGIGSSQLRGLGVGRNVKVKEYGGDTGALRDSCTDVSMGGSGVVKSAAGHPPTNIGGKPANRVVSECCL